MTVNELQSFFGWSLVINYGLLIFSALFILVFKNFAISTHQKLFSLEESTLNLAYFNYLAGYKILIIVFNFVPYLVLRFMI